MHEDVPGARRPRRRATRRPRILRQVLRAHVHRRGGYVEAVRQFLARVHPRVGTREGPFDRHGELDARVARRPRPHRQRRVRSARGQTEQRRGDRRGPSRRSFVPVVADAVHRARVRRIVRRPDDDAPGARNFTAARDGNLDFVRRLAARDRPVVPTLAVSGLDRRRARPVVDGVGDGDLDADGVARGRRRHRRRRDVVHGSRNRSGRGDLLG